LSGVRNSREEDRERKSNNSSTVPQPSTLILSHPLSPFRLGSQPKFTFYQDGVLSHITPCDTRCNIGLLSPLLYYIWGDIFHIFEIQVNIHLWSYRHKYGTELSKSGRCRVYLLRRVNFPIHIHLVRSS
jgi:hypothetical protein